MTRTIGILTVARSDWNFYRPILKLIQKDPDLRSHVICYQPEEDWEVIHPEMEELADEVHSLGFNYSFDSRSTLEYASYLFIGMRYHLPNLDILLVVGDRYEMLVGALAALPFRVPIAHIHGGEETSGAIDNQCRHALTKISNIHFPATALAADRIRQMGEENIHITGSPAIDNLIDILSEIEWQKTQEHILVTYHPETLAGISPEQQISCLLDALDEIIRKPLSILFTMPNKDVGNNAIRVAIENNKSTLDMLRDELTLGPSIPDVLIKEALGPTEYIKAMTNAVLMVGNSSSGLIEAEFLGLPVVNIGDRQKGRERGANVIDVGFDKIQAGIETGLAMENLPVRKSVYGDGSAAKKIVRVLKGVDLEKVMVKEWPKS